jgi:WD40 repeat protein
LRPSSSGRPIALDQAQDDGTEAIAFTADGSRPAIGDRITLWDADLHTRTAVLRNAFPDAPADSPESISALALSPDGRTLAVGGDAGTLQLWDTETQQPLGGPLPTLGEAIDSLTFSSDNSTLYASGAHVPLQRYVIDPTRAVQRVCARAGGELTRNQWRRYAPGTAYRRMCSQR